MPVGPRPPSCAGQHRQFCASHKRYPSPLKPEPGPPLQASTSRRLAPIGILVRVHHLVRAQSERAAPIRLKPSRRGGPPAAFWLVELFGDQLVITAQESAFQRPVTNNLNLVGHGISTPVFGKPHGREHQRRFDRVGTGSWLTSQTNPVEVVVERWSPSCIGRIPSTIPPLVSQPYEVMLA